MTLKTKFMDYSDYYGRGFIGDKLSKKIQNEHKLFTAIKNDKELDLRLRGHKDEIDVYYKGGKLLTISDSKRPRIGDFDRHYTYRSNEVPAPLLDKTISKEERERHAKYREKLLKEKASDRYEQIKNAMSDLFSNPEEYIRTAKMIMDGWFALNPNPERSDQHRIAITNKNFTVNNNLVVIDIEFAVSSLSNCYNKEYMDSEYEKKHKDEKPKRYSNPRFDIIAVDVSGQLYVLELKTGCNSADNAAKHIRDFNNLVGSSEYGDDKEKKEKRWVSFVKEVSQILSSLQQYFAYSKTIKVDTTKKPIFCFAYTDVSDNEFDKKADRKKFVSIIKNALKDDKMPDILLIEKNYFLNLDKENLLK